VRAISLPFWIRRGHAAVVYLDDGRTEETIAIRRRSREETRDPFGGQPTWLDVVEGLSEAERQQADDRQRSAAWLGGRAHPWGAAQAERVGLTRGDTSSKAVKSATHRIVSR
jgi:hypothetical protein